MSLKNSFKISVLIILGCIFPIVFLINYYISLDLLISQLEYRASYDVEEIVSQIEKKGNLISIEGLISNNEFEIEILNDSNYIIASSDSTKGFFFSSDIFEAKKNGFASSIVQKINGSDLEFNYSKSVKIFNQKFIIRCKYNVINFKLWKNKLINLFIIFLIFVCVFIYISVNFLNKELKKPINKLVQHTKQVSSGTKEKIIIDSTDSSLLDLVSEFNNLIDSYNDLIKFDKNKLSNINSFLSNLNTGILVFNIDGEVNLINKKAEELLKIKRFEIFLKKKRKCYNFDSLISFVDEIILSRKSMRFDLKFEKNIIVEVEGRPFFNKYYPNEFSGVVLMIRDVTKLRKLEMVQKEFVSNVSHELKTPLTIISGYVQALLDDEGYLDESEKQLCLDSILHETSRLSDLITQLLIISKLNENREEIEKKFFNPFVLVNKQLFNLRNKAKEKNIIIVVSQKMNEKVYIYNFELFYMQILNNLVDNAIKYSPNNSKIIIDQSIINGEYVLKIIDRGYGIPKSDLDFIFDRFYRVEKSRNSEIAGSGLGLAITNEMVKKLKGRIEVKSEIFEGSTFSVYLPILEKK